MRKLIALVIVLTVLVAVDQGARIVAQNKLEERARAEVPDATDVEAEISSFPFLGRLLVSGSVPRVEVRAERSVVGDLVAAGVEVGLKGVELDRDALFSGQVRLQGIDSGVITIELDAAGLARVLPVPVSITGGEVRVTVAGRSVIAQPTVIGGALVLSVLGLSTFTIPIDRNGLVTCQAAHVAIEDGTVRLSCGIGEVPPALRQ